MERFLKHKGLPIVMPIRQCQIRKNFEVFWKLRGNFNKKERMVEACCKHPVLASLDITIVQVQPLSALDFTFRQVIRTSDPRDFDQSRKPAEIRNKIRPWANQLKTVFHEFLSKMQRLIKTERFITAWIHNTWTWMLTCIYSKRETKYLKNVVLYKCSWILCIVWMYREKKFERIAQKCEEKNNIVFDAKDFVMK